MAISQQRSRTLTCGACGSAFEAEPWWLIDAAERPELAQMIQDGTINTVTCATCGTAQPSNTVLMLHDGMRRQVYMAAPPGEPEQGWRDEAEDVLYALVEALPEERRGGYLGDVRVEDGIAGLSRALVRRNRRAGATQTAGGSGPKMITAESLAAGVGAATRRATTPAAEQKPTPAPRCVPPPAASSDLLETINVLMAADDMAEFQAMITVHPQLLDDTTDAALAEMIETAFSQKQYDVADAMRSVRRTLAQARTGEAEPVLAAAPETADEPIRQERPSPPQLAAGAFAALLGAATPDELLDAARTFPTLLEPWVDDDLAAREEAALDEGNERFATALESHRDALAELRATIGGSDAINEALTALLAATTEDDLEDTITRFPVLLTDAALASLQQVADTARSRNDTERAAFAHERRTMLQAVREGLEA